MFIFSSGLGSHKIKAFCGPLSALWALGTMPALPNDKSALLSTTDIFAVFSYDLQNKPVM